MSLKKWFITTAFIAYIVLILLFVCTKFGNASDFYTVKSGDTLSAIADTHGTTWQKLWEINKSTIPNPNLIFPGQRIAIIAGKPYVPPKALTKEEKIERLAKFMFKTSGLPYTAKHELENNIKSYQLSLMKNTFMQMGNQRMLLGNYYTKTRMYEIWTLSEAIVQQTINDDNLMYTLAGLAWQESHFVNRLGKHQEVSFYQFLPSTVKGYFNVDEIDLIRVLWELENDPAEATAFAIRLIKEHKGNWTLYNSGQGYTDQLKRKINAIKYEFTRR